LVLRRRVSAVLENQVGSADTSLEAALVPMALIAFRMKKYFVPLASPVAA
jgi:hypothetical protein